MFEVRAQFAHDQVGNYTSARALKLIRQVLAFAAVLLIREGKTLADVARLMGHSPRMTTQHYTHVFEQYEGQRSQSMESLVKAARK